MTIEEYMKLPEEEQTKLEKEAINLLKLARKKANDDYSFDELFNESVYCRKYRAEFDSTAEFIIVESEINDLYLYFQYTKRFINDYINKATQFYNEEIATTKEMISEALDCFSDKIISSNQFSNNNSEAVFLMLYKVFEGFLKSMVEVLEASELKIERPQGDFSVLKYMDILKKHDIFIPKELYYQLDEIRLVRNHLVHSNDYLPRDLRRYLAKDECEIVNNNMIVLNNRYVENCFTIIGNIIKKLETTYLKK